MNYEAACILITLGALAYTWMCLCTVWVIEQDNGWSTIFCSFFVILHIGALIYTIHNVGILFTKP